MTEYKIIGANLILFLLFTSVFFFFNKNQFKSIDLSLFYAHIFFFFFVINEEFEEEKIVLIYFFHFWWLFWE